MLPYEPFVLDKFTFASLEALRVSDSGCFLQVMSPRKIVAQTARLEETNEAQAAVFKSLQSVLDHVSHVESSLSDDELAHVLQELANIAKSWSTDRNLLVADLAQARAECEEMKTLALTACQEATGVVERARSQAKSRLEAKRRAKADNKMLQHKNLVLMNTCTALTQQHMADVHQVRSTRNKSDIPCCYSFLCRLTSNTQQSCFNSSCRTFFSCILSL